MRKPPDQTGLAVLEGMEASCGEEDGDQTRAGWRGSLITSVFSNLVSVHCQTVEPKTMLREKIDEKIKQMRQFKVKRSSCSEDQKVQGDRVSQSSVQLSVCRL